ncbi:hypothetical protein BJ166DRAFT_167310 [Pestalotiopsis sp. NC0098]|nr:hypothetical protein BJ166DRAFT_167310 [Pestalotiopsis sp. NC0098]
MDVSYGASLGFSRPRDRDEHCRVPRAWTPARSPARPCRDFSPRVVCAYRPAWVRSYIWHLLLLLGWGGWFSPVRQRVARGEKKRVIIPFGDRVGSCDWSNHAHPKNIHSSMPKLVLGDPAPGMPVTVPCWKNGGCQQTNRPGMGSSERQTGALCASERFACGVLLADHTIGGDRFGTHINSRESLPA